jgi:uncharacterized protein (DUF427 family)
MKHYLIFEYPKALVEVWFKNQKLAVSKKTTLLKEIGGLGHPPIYYFDTQDVALELLEKNDFYMYCYIKGRSTFWTFEGLDKSIWSYLKTIPEAKKLEGKIAFDPKIFKVVAFDK